MSYRSVYIAIGIVALSLEPATLWGASKAYKKPATVPVARLVSTTGPSVVMPVPTDGEINRASELVRKTFADDYKGGSVAKRRDFSRELLRQGVATRDDAAARYVLLVDAADMAAGAGDAVTVARAVDELAKSFQIDPVEMKVIKLAEAAKNAFTKDAIEGAVVCCVAAEEGAVIDERYDQAARLVSIAEGVADRGKRVDLKTTVAERRKELDALRAGASEYAAARDTLAKTPGDAAASLVAGRFLCLVKGDWDKGLPVLAAGGDETLHALAVRDMENPADAGPRAQVGGGWWDYSAKLSGVMRSQARRRAMYWYRQAEPGLAGVNRKALADRLREVQAERMREMNLAPGLYAEMFEGLKFERRRVTRVDAQVDFEWSDKEKPAEGMPKDNFGIAWSGLLNVAQAGPYTFVVVANMGADLELDGTTVFHADDISRKKNGERVTVRLDEGLHPVRLKFWDTTGIAKIKLSWIPPGGATEEVIPAEAFCHDAGEAGGGAVVQVGSIRR